MKTPSSASVQAELVILDIGGRQEIDERIAPENRGAATGAHVGLGPADLGVNVWADNEDRWSDVAEITIFAAAGKIGAEDDIADHPQIGEEEVVLGRCVAVIDVGKADAAIGDTQPAQGGAPGTLRADDRKVAAQ